MDALVELFAARSSEASTLQELIQILPQRDRWKQAHSLFDRIRKKSLEASKQGNHVLESQYLFEEVCAKTIYNLSGQPAPFDADSPYWIIPNAVALARQLGIEDKQILDLIAR